MTVLQFVANIIVTVVVGVIGLIIILVILFGLSYLLTPKIDKSQHLTESQLGTALRDLAEFGACFVSSEIHAFDVSRVAPVEVQVTKTKNGKIWRIQEVNENAQ
jgi:hypothetical protein